MIGDEDLNNKIAGVLKTAGYDCDNSSYFLPEEIDADIIALDSPAVKSCVAKLKGDAKTTNLPIIGIADKLSLDDDNLVLLDDIILLPLKADELVLRIKRLLLKSGRLSNKDIIGVDGLVIDLESYQVTISGEAIELTYKEFELLKFMAANPGRVYNRQILLNQIWEYDYYGGSRTVDVHIRRLRAKLGSKYGSMIQTVRHVGYRFCPKN